MRNAIFISSGIGNALLLVPLIKKLKEQGPLTALSTSEFGARHIFDGVKEELFDDVISLETSVEWMKNTATFQRKFDGVYMDHFASRRKNMILSHMISKEIITNTIPLKLPSLFKSRIRKIEPEIGIHEATQYMRYVNHDFNDSDLNEKLFKLSAKKHTSISEGKYITIQPGSGNNIAPWKTLATNKWTKLISLILESYTDLNIVVLGDESEIDLIPFLPKDDRVIKAIGKTELKDLPGIVSKSIVHIGNDSGIMHLAGCIGTPTVSVWGGSDPDLYGWHKINSKKHKVIHYNLGCGPCSRWIEPNHSKVEVPSMCPDFKCLSQISVNEIMKNVEPFLAP